MYVFALERGVWRQAVKYFLFLVRFGMWMVVQSTHFVLTFSLFFPPTPLFFPSLGDLPEFQKSISIAYSSSSCL